MKKTISLAVILGMAVSLITVPNFTAAAADGGILEESRVDMVDTVGDVTDAWKVVVDNATDKADYWIYNDTVNKGSKPGWVAYSKYTDDVSVEPSSQGIYRSKMFYRSQEIGNPLMLGANPRGRTGMLYYSVQVPHNGRHLQYTEGAYKNFGITFDVQIPNLVVTTSRDPYLDVGLIDSAAAEKIDLSAYKSKEYISMGTTVNMRDISIPSGIAQAEIAPRAAVIDARSVAEFAADSKNYVAGSAETVTDPITNKEYIQSYELSNGYKYYENQILNCKVVVDREVMSLYMKFEDTNEWKHINSYDVSALKDKTKRFYIASAGCQLLVSNLDIWQRESEIEKEEENPKNPDPDDATRVVVLEEDFENFTENVTEESAYGIGKALKVTADSMNIPLSGKTYITGTPNDDRAVWLMTEFDIKTEITEEGTAPTISWTGKNCRVVNTLTLKDNYVTLPYVNDSGVNRSNTYKRLDSDGWNRIRLVTKFELENGEYKGRNKELYINGNNLHSLTPENIGGRLNKNAYNAMYIDSININAEENSTVCIDNLTVTRFYGEEYEDVNYGQLLTSIRRGESALQNAVVGKNITKTIYDDYSAALEKAKGIYETKPTLSETEIANDELCKAYSKFVFADDAYEIGAVNFEDKDGNYAPYLTAGGKITSVTVRKNAEYNKSGVLIPALYDKNGSLIDVMSFGKVFDGVSEKTEKTVPVGMKLPEDIDGVYVKIMLFDTLENLIPLTDAFVPDNTTARTIYIAGDSIVSDYAADAYPRQGWGKYAANYFNDSINAKNYSHSGFTTRTFVGFSNFNNIERNIGKGDVLYFSFMANDSVPGMKNVSKYDYKNMLRLFADTAIGKGAEIVFVTPPPILYDSVPDNYNGYTELMKETAAEYNAPVIDVWQKCVDLQEKKGRAYVEAAMHINNMDVLKLNFGENIRNSANDKIHISEWGAKKIASWITEEMKNTNSVLRYYATGETFDFPEDMKTSADVKAE